ncbi:MAG: peptide deformylase [Alphaproteobacteria bacterium]|nr:peptide deformylase [Alphaproteobacteria bacterium]
MAILKIARMGNPVLRAPARPVADPTAPAIRALVSDMVETMLDAGGVGLAAPQVRVPLRLVIFQLPPERLVAQDSTDGADADIEGDPEGDADGAPADAEHLPLHVLINPVITPVGEDTALGWEGCLSLPRMRGLVPRHTYIRYSGIGLDGKPFEREARGFHARVVQHECDHLDGILYPMRMTDLSLLGYNDEWARAPLEIAADAPGDAEAAE